MSGLVVFLVAVVLRPSARSVVCSVSLGRSRLSFAPFSQLPVSANRMHPPRVPLLMALAMRRPAPLCLSCTSGRVALQPERRCVALSASPQSGQRSALRFGRVMRFFARGWRWTCLSSLFRPLLLPRLWRYLGSSGSKWCLGLQDLACACRACVLARCGGNPAVGRGFCRQFRCLARCPSLYVRSDELNRVWAVDDEGGDVRQDIVVSMVDKGHRVSESSADLVERAEAVGGDASGPRFECRVYRCEFCLVDGFVLRVVQRNGE
ncbi:hypothetical protein HaLaN_26133 [Haematococcus lacustris]|uniref:Secreted protein n=1 Tax=Haematococcus lacustris TaxID=44745 RepID=A0A6A0A5L2_HAELA|nr:hypothetical protein HaLaN_26133 [Haematococcus lacustris]